VRPGDLLFFITGKDSKISHVGIVTKNKGGNDISFIHSADSGVREDNLTLDYYQKSFTKATRPM
ncbi:MAG: C40 family peptidase, partial [Saprospiraceae bacterium]|nr:C40 family peptidase [Saprospiraceae bacterium]